MPAAATRPQTDALRPKTAFWVAGMIISSELVTSLSPCHSNCDSFEWPPSLGWRWYCWLHHVSLWLCKRKTLEMISSKTWGGGGLGYQYGFFFSEKGSLLLVLADRFFNAIFYWRFLTYQDTSTTLLFNSATKIEGVGKFKVWFKTKIHVVLFSCDLVKLGSKYCFLWKG